MIQDRMSVLGRSGYAPYCVGAVPPGELRGFIRDGKVHIASNLPDCPLTGPTKMPRGRHRAMLQMFLSGFSGPEIGRRYRVSSTRVQQMMSHYIRWASERGYIAWKEDPTLNEPAG